MRRLALTALCWLAGAQNVSWSREVPAVLELLVPGETPLPTSAPIPFWDGPAHSVGVISGSVDWTQGSDSIYQRFQVPEAGIRDGSVRITLGVAHDEFVDPDAWPRPDIVSVSSSLAAAVFDDSFIAWHQRYDPADTGKHPPVSVEALRDGCTYSQICRIVVTLGPVPGLQLTKADEWVQVNVGPNALRSGHKPVGRAGFVVVITDNVRYDLLQDRLADAAEMAVLVTMLCGSSSPAAFSTSRMLLLFRNKCGRDVPVTDHAMNPAELGIGESENRLYIGGLVANFLLALLTVGIHLAMVLVQWHLSKESAGESPEKSLAKGDPVYCGGRVNIGELRALQATVRYPHFTLLMPLFLFQGIASCAFKLLFDGGGSGDVILGIVALTVYCGGLLLLAWWKVGKAGVARVEAEFINVGGQRKLAAYLLGDGEWVSTTRRRLVHTYGVLFDCYRERWVSFVVWELAVMLPLAALGAHVAETWGSCITQGVLTCVVLTAFLIAVIKMLPWASPLDNHFVLVTTVLMLLSVVLATASHGGHSVDSPLADISAWMLIAATGLIVLKAGMDCVLLVHDTYVSRRGRLQEAFEQGQTLYRGHDEFLKREGLEKEVKDEAVLALLAPQAVSAFMHHILPPAGRKPEEDQAPADDDDHAAALLDPFDHAPTCTVQQGLLYLSAMARRKLRCPICQAPRLHGAPPAEHTEPDVPSVGSRDDAAGTTPSPKWKRFFTEDGAAYYHCAATGQTTWEEPPADQCEDDGSEDEEWLGRMPV